ncbi:MAG: hypothetical protein HKN47_25280 [Pirellulaceae bacterium]|nr:hypothetical protein [Pirellulaceae bacterium]
MKTPYRLTTDSRRRKELPHMQRIANYARALIAMVLVSVSAGTVAADWHQFWNNVDKGYHRNNAWPDPFNEADAMHVVAPFEVMKRNGWRLHNTIGHELFRSGDGALLASGNQKIQWIATQAPPHRREVYVLRGRSDVETQARVASVKTTLTRHTRNGPIPSVLVTDIEPSSASGAWATQINRTWLEELPAPRLPNTSAAGTASATQE